MAVAVAESYILLHRQQAERERERERSGEQAAEAYGQMPLENIYPRL